MSPGALGISTLHGAFGCGSLLGHLSPKGVFRYKLAGYEVKRGVYGDYMEFISTFAGAT